MLKLVRQQYFFIVPSLFIRKKRILHTDLKLHLIMIQQNYYMLFIKRNYQKQKSKRMKDLQQQQENKLKTNQKSGLDLLQNVLKHVYIDKETDCLFGLFDDFVYDIKTKRGQQYEAEYNRKVSGLLSQNESNVRDRAFINIIRFAGEE